MAILRTPDSRFKNLPGFPFESKYININGNRIHYIEEGQGDEVILCLHGEPSWSYLYRKMIPIFKEHYRVVAFDFIGFGKSDKFPSQKDYNYEMHYNTLKSFVEQLDLHNITLIVQDWGGILGLPYATDHTERISRLVILNTMIPAGSNKSYWQLLPRAFPFFAWQAFSKYSPSLPIGRLIQAATVSKLSKEVIAAYNAPFPDSSYKAGAKVWPQLVPIFASNPAAVYTRRARNRLAEWEKPALVLFSDSDPITGSHAEFFYNLIPTAKNQPLETIQNAGHFLQEDKGEEIAEKVVAFMKNTRLNISG